MVKVSLVQDDSRCGPTKRRLTGDRVRLVPPRASVSYGRYAAVSQGAVARRRGGSRAEREALRERERRLSFLLSLSLLKPAAIRIARPCIGFSLLSFFFLIVYFDFFLFNCFFFHFRDRSRKYVVLTNISSRMSLLKSWAQKWVGNTFEIRKISSVEPMLAKRLFAYRANY